MIDLAKIRVYTRQIGAGPLPDIRAGSRLADLILLRSEGDTFPFAGGQPFIEVAPMVEPYRPAGYGYARSVPLYNEQVRMAHLCAISIRRGPK
jgi:hypothetical protein